MLAEGPDARIRQKPSIDHGGLEPPARSFLRISMPYAIVVLPEVLSMRQNPDKSALLNSAVLSALARC